MLSYFGIQFRPMLVVACAVTLGMVIADREWGNRTFFWMIALFSALIGITLYIWFYRGIVPTLFCCFFGLAGFYYTITQEANYSQFAADWEDKQLMVSGSITSGTRYDQGKVQLILSVDRVLYKDQWRAILPERMLWSIYFQTEKEQELANQLKRNRKVIAFIRFNRPQIASNPGGFDYQQYLYRQKIHWVATSRSIGQIQWLSKSSGFDLWNWIDEQRKRVNQQLDLFYPKSLAGLMKSMITGERNEVDDSLEQLYSQLGIIHLISISGMHVTGLVGVCFWMLRRLRITREKAASILMLMLPLYMIFAGAEPPVIRAGIMGILGLFAICIGRWQDIISFLATAYVLQLGWNPYQLWDVGFQLSFFVTAALIIVVPSLVERFGPIWSGFISACVAEAVSFPIIIYHYYQSSIFSCISNLLLTPILTLLLYPIACISLLISLIWQAGGKWLADWNRILIEQIHQLMLFVRPLFTWHASWEPPSLGWCLFYYFLLLVTWWVLSSQHIRFHWQHRISLLCLIGIVLIIFQQPSSWFLHETRVTFIDVGQGDATLIETNEGRVILIDGGGLPSFTKQGQTFDVGMRVVVPFLRYRGIQRIDDLIVTHGDFDHYGGLLAVTKQLPIGRVIRNGFPAQTKEERRLIHLWREMKIPIVQAHDGISGVIEQGIEWSFWNPHHSYRHLEEETNHHSIVTLFTIHGYKLLMTGDIDEAAEMELMKHRDLKQIDILKVAHHGSKTSSSADYPKLHHIIFLQKMYKVHYIKRKRNSQGIFCI
ncbi:competence protein ComEC [Seinonella peptonophila]|uniref:Competence protein ComEC n=1 Tax=Seinonella peptonophila TaxID=112248 RepID=A0A1M4VFX5_9BACL|nr:DNA internalization-related competence protein ComEC/Rec2 [Seinonella peptonophila]SHE67733.1 competence protein ComEC [Seinonella peptonophila]